MLSYLLVRLNLKSTDKKSNWWNCERIIGDGFIVLSNGKFALITLIYKIVHLEFLHSYMNITCIDHKQRNYLAFFFSR